MQDISDVFLNDTQIPDVFITDYMPALSHISIKVYLMASLHMSHDRKVSSKPVRQALGLEVEDFKAAICELAGQNIVATESDFSAFVLLDLKRQVLDRFYRRLTAVPMKESVDRNAQHKERSSLISSINDTYFHGLMGPAWYQAIDSWFDRYQFEPSVVYQMFVDAAQRNVLNGPNYLNKVAEDYSKHGIRSFMELSKYKDENKKVRLIAQQIGKKLNKKITEYDIDLIEKWVVVYAYDFSTIELALRHAVRLSDPNLNYFDKILSGWHEAGIRTTEEARNVEENNARQKQGQRRSAAAKRSDSRDNHQQRDYDDSYLNQFYRFALLDEKDTAGEAKEES